MTKLAFYVGSKPRLLLSTSISLYGAPFNRNHWRFEQCCFYRSSPMTTIKWSQYAFEVYPANSSWNNASGIYIFATSSNGYWKPLYIGQASSFKDRFSQHEKWDSAIKLGMTHIHVMVVSRQSDRDAIEKYLISVFKPQLNDNLK